MNNPYQQTIADLMDVCISACVPVYHMAIQRTYCRCPHRCKAHSAVSLLFLEHTARVPGILI